MDKIKIKIIHQIGFCIFIPEFKQQNWENAQKHVNFRLKNLEKVAVKTMTLKSLSK